MPGYYLGSVGNVIAYQKRQGIKQIAFVANTLSQNSVSVSISQDEIRGGNKGILFGSFLHSPQLNISFTDILWNIKYLQIATGSSLKMSGVVTSYQEIVESAGEATPTRLTYIPVDSPFFAGDLGEIFVDSRSRLSVLLSFPLGELPKKILISKAGSDDWHWYEGVITNNIIYLPEGRWAVSYMAEVPGAHELMINTNLYSLELDLEITVPLYNSSSCIGSSRIGHITFEIPRFKVNSDVKLDFNMSSTVAMEISGRALAVGAAGNKMMKIVEVDTNYDFTNEISEVVLVGE